MSREENATGAAGAPLVFDTNALIFLFVDSPRLTDAVRRVLEETGRDRWASAASVYEVALKARLGRLSIDPMRFRESLRLGGFDVRPITEHVIYAAATLEWVNRDPWDRIIAATARQAGKHLVSSDEAFDEVEGIERIW